MLTRKQTELLLFINRRLAEDGVSPSFEEMKEALDLRSKSGIHRLITGLEERGFIRRLPHKARALEVLRLPESASRAAGDNVVRLRPAREPAGPAPATSENLADLPLLGRIAAGTPIEALAGHARSVPVPVAMLGRGKNYALEIAGDSMTGEGILDGDTVIIEETQTAQPGDIVVALVDREEATLKRYRRESGRIVLEAANPAYPAQIYEADRVQVQGRLVGLLRRY